MPLFDIFFTRRRGRVPGAARLLLLATAGLTVLTLLQDYWRSVWLSTGYVFTESVLFAGYWLLCWPLLLWQWRRQQASASFWQIAGCGVLAVLAQWLLYPTLISWLSGWWLGHQYAWWKVGQYMLTELLYPTLLLFSLPVAGWLWQIRQQPADEQPACPPAVAVSAPARPVSAMAAHFLVQQKGRQLRLPAKEVLYLSSRPPYTALHTAGGVYLQASSLKSIEATLDGEAFVRIHRSVLVQLSAVQHIRSRGNGDYDVYLDNGTLLRLSRRYAARFLQGWRQQPSAQ